MASDRPLLLSTILAGIEVEGIENGKWTIPLHYSVRLYVADTLVAKSKSKPHSAVIKFDWNTDNQIWFEPSSVMKVVLYRGFKLFDVGKYEGKLVDLLENNTSYDLTDKKGKNRNAKMKIVLSRISGTIDNIKEFMEKVDADVSRLPCSGTVTSTLSTFVQVLKLTKTIMDRLSKAHPILDASWTVISCLYEAVQDTDFKDESIKDLASTLRELLGAANAIPNLPVIPNTADVIEAISRQSLEVASLIHEYTKLRWAVRTFIPSDLKSRIDGCQKRCAALKDDFYNRLHLDTNTQVKKINTGLQVIKDDKLAEKIIEWLSPPDSSRNRNEAHGKRQADTCSWFLESERFLRWLGNPGFLWVKGMPGCGKSILCSSIIDKLPEPDQSHGIAYFFFDGRDGQTELQLHNKVVRSLIVQLSDMRHGGIPVELADLHKKCGVQQPLDHQLENVLRNILDRFTDTYIVIDALDECTDREKTLDWVNTLASNTERKANLHIVVTSRPELDIEEVFGRLDPDSIDVAKATANQDIMKYLKLQMKSKAKFTKYDNKTRTKIELELAKRAEGSFRWVALQLTELEKCSSQDEITKQLVELPKGLDEFYNRILKRIDEKHRGDTRTFLQWLAFSQRPMRIAEIAETITVDFASEDSPVFNSSKRYLDPRDVLERCSSLVSESEDTIKLSHFSVKEYLLSPRIEKYFRISAETSHSKISEISVAYILQFDSFTPLTKDIYVSSPLARYAAQNWIDHAKSGGMDRAVLKLILRLFTSATAAFRNWIWMYDIDQIWSSRDVKARVQSPLYYASVAGLQEVSEQLLGKEVDVNARGGRYGNALQAASFRGHEGIVKLLLEKEVDVNAQGGEYGNALYAASSEGHEGIVKLLLEKEANVNVQGGRYGNALQVASSGGHEGIVKLLLEKEADVNVQGGLCSNALYAASSGGHKGVVKLLLEKEADVNAQGGLYSNALQAACSGGHEGVVKLLLEKGADVNAQGGQYGNSLQAASSGGHEGVVKLLLEKGADVNARGGYYSNALQAASSRDHEGTVKLLLEKDVDVNAQDRFYGNALQVASLEGHERIVKLLLEKEADVNAQGGHYGNALQVASFHGHEGIVKLLLEKEADVNAHGGEYGNALQAASLGGHKGIVKLLLEKGADMNGVYGNALQAASSGGHEGIAKLLLEKGADVNAQGGEYGSALQAASSGGHDGIVKLLLEKEADVNAQGGEYGSALQLASSGGHEGIVKLLLEKEADVNARGGRYGNALPAASSGGHEGVVKLLLEKGADVNARAGKYGNALQLASCRGHKGVVKLLLEKKADVNVQGGKYGTALYAASEGAHEGIVKLLLETEVDVNARGGVYGNALLVASSGGHEGIVKLLLEKEADVNAQGGQYGNALQAASSRGHEGIVKLLLKKEADVNAQGGQYGNSLQAASSGGHEGIVKLLLEKEADVNAQERYYGNALQAASLQDHEGIVKLLLENGADVNAQGGADGNALQAASSRGHVGIVKLLLEKGADVNAQGGQSGSALRAASSRGHQGIVRLLLEKGADVNAQGGGYGDALQAASSGGHQGIVKLLKKVMDVNAQGGFYGNALEVASSGGHEGIVKRFLDTEMDVNTQRGI